MPPDLINNRPKKQYCKLKPETERKALYCRTKIDCKISQNKIIDLKEKLQVMLPDRNSDF